MPRIALASPVYGRLEWNAEITVNHLDFYDDVDCLITTVHWSSQSNMSCLPWAYQVAALDSYPREASERRNTRAAIPTTATSERTALGRTDSGPTQSLPGIVTNWLWQRTLCCLSNSLPYRRVFSCSENDGGPFSSACFWWVTWSVREKKLAVFTLTWKPKKGVGVVDDSSRCTDD